MESKFLNKKELRKFALEKRKYMTQEGITEINSRRIVSEILNSKEFILAENIALYYPIKGEIDLTSLLKIKNKNFYLPRCNGNKLDFVKYDNEKSLITGAYNIPEPKGKCVNPDILDIIYVPALIANKNGYRLGYGKGFYDRFFFENKNIKAKKIIVISDCLITDNFTEETTDIKCDSVLSERCLIFA